MYAILETGGKQYVVEPGDTIFVEKLPYQEGEEVILDKVLMVAKDDGEVTIGTPVVEGASVKATVIAQRKGKKVLGFKYLPRDRYRRKIGHRQNYTWLLVESIEA